MQSGECLLLFCGNLRKLRKAHGLSKKKMASILGISVRSLTLLENDVIPPRPGCDMLFRTSQYFKIRVCELFLPMEES